MYLGVHKKHVRYLTVSSFVLCTFDSQLFDIFIYFDSQTVKSMSDAITAQVLDNLKASGIVAHSIWSQSNIEGETTAIEIRFDNSEHPIIHIPAQNIVSEFEILKHNDYKPSVKPLYSKINSKLH